MRSFYVLMLSEAFIKKMHFLINLLSNKYLTNRKGRIVNDLETSEPLWSALVYHRFK